MPSLLPMAPAALSRPLTLAALLAALACTPSRLRADDAPPAPPKPVEAPAAPEKPAPEKPGEAPATPEKPALPKPVEAPALAKPSEAWRSLVQDMNDPAKRRPNLQETRAKEYLAQWEASKAETPPEEAFALGMLLNAAKRSEDAAASFRSAAVCEKVPGPQRAQAAIQYANLMVQAADTGKLKGEALAAAVKEVEGWTPLAEGQLKGGYLMTLGNLHRAAGQQGRAFDDWVGAAEANHPMAYGMADRIVDELLSGVRSGEQAQAARAQAEPLLAKLRGFQEAAAADARKAADAETDSAKKGRLEQSAKQAEAMLKRFGDVDRPLRMIGTPAEAWTLVKAYGKGQALEDYKGKVVVIDFWATWCPWCIKSFPALRDLLKDYAGKDLVVVGVTASSSNVYDQRYDLDDDLKSKASASPVKPVLQRPKPPAALKPDADEAAKAKHAEAQAAYEKALAEFPAREQEVIATFIANHAMTWDVVQIDPQEPGPKYALGGWPHCVVIDREGRVRHFKSGALLREKPEGVAKFRAVLDRLLAEPAAGQPAATK